MNPLLARQIRKYLPEHLKEDAALDRFLTAVGNSYDNLDEQFAMTQRAMSISSEELFEANKALREETHQQQQLLQRLQAVINHIQPQTDDLETASLRNNSKERSLAEYISNQAEQLIEFNRKQEQLLEELALQNQELSDYAHIVSHDLKSPLRSMEALLSWIKEDYAEVLDEEGLQKMDLIVSYLEKMDALITGILKYSSIGKDLHQNQEVNLNGLVQDTLDVLQVPPHIKVKANDLPTLWVDRFKMQQLFQNLIDNAIAHIDKKEGRVDIIARTLGQEYQFEIKDNGIGIDPAYYSKIFQVFQTLDSDSNSTGIGLAIVKKIITFYGGSIRVESQLNYGTSFIFSLPIKNVHGKA